MVGVYRKQVREYGLLMFGELWDLRPVPQAGSGAHGTQYQVVSIVNGKAQSLTDALPIIDFVLFWDGFRFAADEMKR